MNKGKQSTLNRDVLIDLMVDNLHPLRAKSGFTQSALADSIGIGRQTMLLLENKRSKMRWDTFLALVLIFSQDSKANNYMAFLGIDLDTVQGFVQGDISNRKGGIVLNFDKLWTDYDSEYSIVNGICPLPLGMRGAACSKCGSKNITGALITETADEADPNVLCKDCGYWRD